MTETLSRSKIVDEIMKTVFPYFMSNEDTKTKIQFLSTYFKCDCTDCYGDNAECECQVEKAFFKFKKDENVIEHTML